MRFGMAIIVTLSMMTVSSQAANRWWDGTSTGGTGNGASDGGTATWDTSTLNWDQGNGLARVAWVNGNNDTAIFAGTAGTVSLGTGITIGGLQFDTASYIIQNNTLTWGTAGSIIANQNATISSVMAGSVAVTKSGAGTLTLSGKSTYTGGTIVNEGIVALNAGGHPGTLRGALTINSNATVNLTAGDALGVVAGSQVSPVNIVTGTLNIALNANEGYNTDFYLTGGRMTSTGGGSFHFNARSLNSLASSTQSVISAGIMIRTSPLTISNAVGTTSDGVDMRISGAISQFASGYSVVKTGPGKLMFASAPGYSGNTIISNGTLVVSNTSASASYTVDSGATLEFMVGSGTRNMSTSASLSGAGTLRKTGGGTLLWGSAAATFSLSPGALIDVQAGQFLGGSSANEVWTANSSDLNVESGATFNGVEANVRVNALTGSGTIQSGYSGAGYQNFTFGVANGSATFNGVLADSTYPGYFVKAGTGTQVLAGTNTYTGTTTINAGTLEIGGAGQLGSGSYAGNITNHNTLVFNSSAAQTLSGVVSGTGALTKASSGTLTLSGVNTYTGGTTIDAGTLEIGGAGQLGSGSYAPGIANDGVLFVNSTAAQALSGIISGTGTLVKANSGTLTLTGVNTFTGATAVNGGTILVNSPGSLHGSSAVTVASGGKLGGNGTVNGAVTVSTSGILSPGSTAGAIGTLTLGSTLSLTGATLLYDLTSAATPGTTYDQIVVSGALTMSGANVIYLGAPSGSIAVGTYTLITFANSTASTFTLENGSTVMTIGGTTLTLVNGATSLQLTISGAPLTDDDFNALKWYGPGGATVWDTSTANWIKNGVASLYVAGDHVTFDDSAVTYTVTGSGSPASVTLNNLTPYTISAAIGGTGTVTKTRSGTVTLGSANTFSGGLRVNAGTIKMGNASALGSGRVTLARGGTLDLNGNGYSPTTATLTSSNGSSIVNTHASASPTITVAGGTIVTFDGTIDDSAGAAINFDIGNGGAQATFSSTSNSLRGSIANIPNGGVTVANMNPGTFGTGDIAIGNGANVPYLQYNGSANSSDNSRSLALKGSTSGGATLYASGGGTLTFGGAYASTAYSQMLYLAGTNTGNNTMGGLIWNGNGTMSVTKNGVGTWVLSGTNTYTGTTTVNAGTLKAGVVSVANVSGAFGNNSAVTMANTAGAILDLNNFNTQIGSLTGGGSSGGNVVLGSATLTVGGNNTSPSAYAGLISGSGGLTKIGTGTLQLGNTNTYTGATAVNAGKLVVISGGPVHGATTLADGATLSVQVTTSGNSWSSGSLTLSSGTTTNEFDYQITPSTTIAPIQVNGNFINNGTLNVYIAGGAFAAGTTYPLIKYTGTLTVGTLGTVTFASGFAGTLVNNPGNKSIDLHVSSVSPLIWSAGNGVWDINTTANWNSQTTVYTEGRPVQFDDSANGSGTYIVNVTSPVNPGGVLVNNVTRDIWIGNQPIEGGTYLTKSGAATLTLYAGTAHSYSGGTVINSGTLNFGAVPPNGFGSIRGALTINTGATVNAGNSWSLGYAGGVSVDAITIDQGTLNFAGSGGSGGTAASTITLKGGTIDGNGNGNYMGWYYGNTTAPTLTTIAGPDRSTISANLYLRADTFTFNVPAGTTGDGIDLYVGGKIDGNTGDGANRVIKSGTGMMMLTNVCTYAGGTTVNGGTLGLGYVSANLLVGTIRGALTVNSGATVTSAVANAFGLSTITGVGTLNINGGNVDLSAGQHHIWGTTVNMVGGTLKFSSSTANEHFDVVYNISNSTSQAQILAQPGGAMRMRNSVSAPCITFNVANGSQAVDLLVDVPITVGNGAGGLTKTGAGTVEFTKANTYNGPTAINAGRLFVNGTSSGGSAHTVEIGATLAGSGTVPGATTVNGIIAPGSLTNPTGTLNVAGNVTWNGASGNAVTTRDWYFDLGPNNTSDTLNISGNFLKGSGDQFRFNFGGTTEQGTFTLVDWSGTTTFSESDFSYDASSLGNFQEVYFLIDGSQLKVVLYGPCPTPPTATLGASPTVCRGTTSASISYSNPQESPTLYSIDYDNTANTVGGFTDVNLTALGASPISLSVPEAAPVGTYNASLYLVNGDGCRSLAIPFTVNVIDTPSTPGTISGSASVCHDTSGVVYSIAAVSSATNYNWTVPANATLISGQGTTSITVDWGAAGSGSITVNAQNSCGTSANRSLSVTVHAGEPDAPVALPAKILSETSFIANWSAAAGATSYYLDVARTETFDIGTYVVLDQAVAGTSYTVSGLTSGSNYYYRVRGANACGLGGNSATITAVPTPLLAAWDMSGLSNYGDSPQAATEANDDVTAGGLLRGGGLSGGTSAVRGWGATGWALTEADATNGGNVATFTIKGDTDRNVSFISISTFDYRLDSASGPTSGKIQYSLDGSIFYDIATNAYAVNVSGNSLSPIDLSGITALQNVPDSVTVTFRVVNYGASSASEPWYIYDKGNSAANDFEVRGTICVSPVSYALNGGGTFCSDTFTDTQLTLADSEVGVFYQLYTNNGANAVGSPVAGTGNSISFGFHSAPDEYTVVGTRTAGGCSEVVGSATITVLTTPGTPTGFSATLNGNDVDLAWNSVAGATGYKVYRRLSTDIGYGAAVATVSGGGTVTYTDSPSGGLSYYYQLSAINGSCEGAVSSEDGPVAVPLYCPTGIRPTLTTQGLTALAASVRVNVAPSLDISIIAVDSTGCTPPSFAMSGISGATPGVTITDTPDSPVAGSHTRRIQWVPGVNEVGTYPVTLKATDSEGLSTSITFVIYVGQQSDTLVGGVPTSQTNWNIPIVDIRVPSSGNATVEWVSADGIMYDVYVSTQPIGGSASWAKIVSDHEAAGSSTYTDVVASGSARYYNVVPSGQPANERGVWGIVRPVVTEISFLSPPVDIVDRSFNAATEGSLGQILADVLPVGTLIYVLTPGASGSFDTTLELNGLGSWIGGDAYSLPEGQGFMVRQPPGSPSVSPTFAGSVGNDGTGSITIEPGYNLIGISEGKSLAASTAFENAAPVGSYDESAADQVVIMNANGSWRRLIRRPSPDNTWYDTANPNSSANTSLKLLPGQSYYYIRQGGQTSLDF